MAVVAHSHARLLPGAASRVVSVKLALHCKDNNPRLLPLQPLAIWPVHATQTSHTSGARATYSGGATLIVFFFFKENQWWILAKPKKKYGLIWPNQYPESFFNFVKRHNFPNQPLAEFRPDLEIPSRSYRNSNLMMKNIFFI